MRARLIELRERGARLRERAARERAALGEWLGRAEALEGLATKGFAAADWLRKRPLWIAAGVALLLALRPRRALGWLSKGITVWQVWREARALWQHLAPAGAALKRAH